MRGELLVQVRRTTLAYLGLFVGGGGGGRSAVGQGVLGEEKVTEAQVQRTTGDRNHYRRGGWGFAVLGFAMREWKVRKARGQSEIGETVAKRDTTREAAGAGWKLAKVLSCPVVPVIYMYKCGAVQVQAWAIILRPAALYQNQCTCMEKAVVRLAPNDPLGLAGCFVTLSICCLLGLSLFPFLRNVPRKRTMARTL